MESSFRVGSWRVDPQAGRITGPDTSRRIQPMLMRLLIYLARNAGQVVSKKRLIDEVWKGVHVTEDALTHSISELRKALSDDARNPRIIATIPKRGYRLVASVMAHDLGAGEGALPLRYAVLPFESLGSDAESRHFAGVITDLLITHLAKIENIRVISKLAVTLHENLTSQAILELGADRVLEGSVLQADGRLRVSVRLIDQKSEYLWAEIYEQDSSNVLSRQDELTASIVREVVAEKAGPIAPTPE